jgi:hypothetical protein
MLSILMAGLAHEVYREARKALYLEHNPVERYFNIEPASPVVVIVPFAG